jgi:hypothetical protein
MFMHGAILGIKGIPRKICEHKIELMVNAQPIKQKDT